MEEPRGKTIFYQCDRPGNTHPQVLTPLQGRSESRTMTGALSRIASAASMGSFGSTPNHSAKESPNIPWKPRSNTSATKRSEVNAPHTTPRTFLLDSQGVSSSVSGRSVESRGAVSDRWLVDMVEKLKKGPQSGIAHHP